MRRVHDEKGYTLFTALLIAILFTVLAMSLLSITMSGLTKNTTREQLVQARELSEKGLLHITKDIQKQLNDVLESEPNGMTESEFIDELNTILDKYSCEDNQGLNESSKNIKAGSYEACIDKNHPDRDRTKPLQLVTFKSKGKVDGREQNLETTIEIGAEPGPEELKYAVSTFKSKECKERQSDCRDGEGNLFLHGGVTIEGDLKVDGNLIVAEKAYTPARDRDYRLIQGDVFWVDSTLPIVKNSNLMLAGDVYKYKNPDGSGNKVNRYNNHINRTNFETSDYEKLTNRLDEAFHESKPELTNIELNRSDIGVKEAISAFAYNENDNGVGGINSAGFLQFLQHPWPYTFKNINYPNSKLYGFVCPQGLINQCLWPFQPDYNENFSLIGNNNRIYQFAVKRDLHIGRPLTDIFNEGIVINMYERNGEQGGIYVGRNLTIGRSIATDIGQVIGDPNLQTKINGNIFVEGDLVITGINGEFNSIIYVNGNVTIDHSKFRGVVQDGKERSLIVFATGKIEFIKNSLFKNTPSELRGFFYSEEGIEIYTSGSNMRIYGGLSAPRIVLNSTRGRAGLGGLLGIVTPFSPYQKVGMLYFDTKSNQATRPSRLQVIYDSEILETYSDLIPGEDRVYNILPPKIVDRETNTN